MSVKTRVKRPSVSIGQIFDTNHGKCKLTQYNGWQSVEVEFEDGFRTCVQLSQLRAGTVRNPYFPTIEGIGFLGEGEFKASNGRESTKVYYAWITMLRRCYSESQQKRQPSYRGCSVSKEWHNFQNFAAWYIPNYVEGWHMDKDLLIKGNRVYSSDNCCFLPLEINSFLTNRAANRGRCVIGVVPTKAGNFIGNFLAEDGKVRGKTVGTELEAFHLYKESKEKRAKQLANKWGEMLSSSAYNALMNYTVDITD